MDELPYRKERVRRPGAIIIRIASPVWLAGAGLKPGFAYGTSDELGREPAENPVTVHDLHATALHLLGLDHEKLTFYHNGIRRRLTDVHGHVVQGILTSESR